MRRPGNWATAFSLAVLLSVRPCAAEPLRWAILADEGKESQKTSDLLFDRLSVNQELELVERDLLGQVAKEHQLSAMLSVEGVDSRARLLRLVKAERLVLLSVHSEQSPPRLDVVVAESEQGARLAARQLRIDCEEEAVGQVVELIDHCRRHYAKGIHAVVGVAPLSPDNLEHDYDYLSTTYRDLLEGEISLVPGVAVIEMDEARAIAREIAIGGGDVRGRITPILIDGHYEVVDRGRRVVFDVKATQRQTELVSVQAEVARSDVPSFFREQVSSRALNRPAGAERVSVDEQFDWLATQAEAFSRLGLPKRAAGLREAALLLKPDNVKERLSLLADYRKIFGRRDPLPKDLTGDEKWRAFDEQAARHVALYVTSLHHVEYLIMNRLIDREVAADLISQHAAGGLILPFPYHYTAGGDGEPPKRAGGDILIRAEEAEFAMHRLVMPVFETLPIPEPNLGLGLRNFDISLMRSYLNRIDSAGTTSRQLEECLHYFSQWFPEDWPTSYDLLEFFGQKKPEDNQFALITSDQWTSFLDDLIRSERAVVRALAEYGRIRVELWRESELNGAEKKVVAARVRALMSDWEALPKPRYSDRKKEPIYEELQRTLERLAPHEKVARPKRQHPTRPDNWQTDPSTWGYWGYPPMLGHLRFRKLDVSLPGGQEIRARGPNLSFTKGTEKVDFLWSRTGVWLLDAGLRVSPIANDAPKPINQVQWDGSCLWVLSGGEYGKSKHSLAVYDAEGKRLAGLGAEDFSDHDVSMRILTLREGAACVTGTFFPHNRTWLAIVTREDGKLSVNEFHHAKKVPTITKRERDFGDPDLAFVPTWMHLMDMGKHKPRVLLIGRDRTTTYERFHPLAIDLESLEVRVHPYELGYRGENKNYFSVDGELLRDDNFHVTHWARPGDVFEDGKPWKHRCTNMHRAGHLGMGFVVHGRFLHVTGRKWFRINLDTMQEEEMTRGLVPDKWRMHWYGSSSNHGLIGFNGNLYSISFAEKHLFTEDE